MPFTFLHSQHPGFTSPFDFRLLLSGTFGELRSNHFHSGIDIKTGGVEGKDVRVVADGWVSRINISPYGFGKAIYVNHPGGYTSVYGHLKSLNGAIGEYALEQQYKLESFTVDISVPQGLFAVKQGDIIAKSGNSGGSGGPHLHFEIRDAATQEPMDPMSLGIEVKDNIRPSIQGLKLYPEGPGSTINGLAEAKSYPVLGWGPSRRIETNDTIRVKGGISFGIEAFDILNDASNRNGIFSIRAYADDVLFYSHSMDRFSFAETRYINALIDYAELKKSGRRYQRTHIAPNNKLSIYEGVLNKGVLWRESGSCILKIIVADHKGNESILSFPLIFSQDGKGNLHRFHQKPPAGHCISWKQDQLVREEGFMMSIPGNALYDSVCIEYSKSEAPKACFGPLHRIHNNLTPLHTYCSLSLNADALPARLRSKAIVVSVDEKGRISDAGGKWEDGWLKTRVRDFGAYSISVDTIAPKVLSLSIVSGKSIRAHKELQFRISDNLSGIDSYRLEVNGKWVLAEYDPKRTLLIYPVDLKHFNAAVNRVLLRVKDDKGNESELELSLTK